MSTQIDELLLQRVENLKKQLGVSYKFICKKCNIPISVFYNFTGRVRDLPEKYKQGVDLYLKSIGF